MEKIFIVSSRIHSKQLIQNGFKTDFLNSIWIFFSTEAQAYFSCRQTSQLFSRGWLQRLLVEWKWMVTSMNISSFTPQAAGDQHIQIILILCQEETAQCLQVGGSGKALEILNTAWYALKTTGNFPRYLRVWKALWISGVFTFCSNHRGCWLGNDFTCLFTYKLIWINYLSEDQVPLFL